MDWLKSQIQGAGLQEVERIQMIQFTIPNTFYNVSSSNNTVCWNRSSTNYSYQIPSGQYSISTLLTTIQSGMNGVDNNSYALSYSSSTFMVTVTGSSAFMLNWNSNPNASTGCYQQLGFTKQDTSSSTSITGSNVVDLAIPEYVFMDINELPGSMGTTSASSITNKLNFVIPLYESNGNLVYVLEENIHEELRFKPPINLSNLTVQLKDKNSSILNTNGSNWHMIWEVHYAK